MKINRFAVWPLIIALVAAVLTGCTNQENNVDLGITEDGTYNNDYFGITLSLPKGWENNPASSIFETTSEPVPISELKNKTSEQQDLNSAMILNLVKAYDPSSSEVEDPFVRVAAVKLDTLPNVKTSKDYFESVQTMLEEPGSPYVITDTETVVIGGKQMDKIVYTLQSNGSTVHYECYTTKVKKYGLTINVSYLDEQSKAKVDEVLESITMK